MAGLTLFSVAVQAAQLRNAQKTYFKLITIARKYKKPLDYTSAHIAFVQLQVLEQKFDETISSILNAE